MTDGPAVSLRRRLLTLLLCGIFACWLIAALVTYQLVLRQVNRLADEDMLDFGSAALHLATLSEGATTACRPRRAPWNAAARPSPTCRCSSAATPWAICCRPVTSASAPPRRPPAWPTSHPVSAVCWPTGSTGACCA
ncbi:hypothetical protein [Pseudomonas oryzihabitans]|uniref:hypothetical protein n=1 Tax=Pseudomonas oryzihabitans TaxID=47885 RepID=UPI002095599E|nr:hypothetical protein [Pseudomonas psychrotolerans]